ncbi:hypothetical protein MASR1M48_16440 [Lactococcus petauri]
MWNPPKQLAYIIVLELLSKDIEKWITREEVVNLSFERKDEYEKEPLSFGKQILLCSSKPLWDKAEKVTLELFPEHK